MRPSILAAGLSVALSGCGLPPALTVASLALDFASYGQTGKTVSDHGLSFVLNRDCVLLRALDGPVCRSGAEAGTATALAGLNALTDPAADVTASGDPVLVPPDLAYLAEEAGGVLGSAPAGQSRLALARGFAADPAIAPDETPRSRALATLIRQWRNPDRRPRPPAPAAPARVVRTGADNRGR